MIYVGIDISKYKHDCFICKDTGEVIVENLSFANNKKGFQQFLDLLKPYDNSNVHIGLEATGHYGLNLKLFLEKNNYSFMEFNPLLVKEFYKSLTLRKTKTDKVDATVIARKLMSVPYKPDSKLFYHKYSIKSLSRLRETLVKQRSKYKVQLTNILDMTFPEFKPFFANSFGVTSLYILEKYKTPEKIANMRDFDTPNKLSRGKFTYAKFVKLKDLAKNTIGESNNIFELELSSILNLYQNIDEQIIELDKQISTIIKNLNPPTLSIPGIGVIIHYDETSPHLHIVGVPIKYKNKNGMSKQVGKSDVFTKTELMKIQNKMRVLCIESFNKEYGLNNSLKTKQKGRNKDINVKDMINYQAMKDELEKNQKKLEIANKKSQDLDQNSSDIKDTINNLKKTPIVKNTYTISESDRNKIINYIDKVDNTNQEYKNMQMLSITLNNVDNELKENREKIK